MDTTIKQILEEINAGAYGAPNWPLDIRALLSAIRQPPHLKNDRRRQKKNRIRFEVDAVLEFQDCNTKTQKVPVYPRDVGYFGIGVVVAHRLEAGQRASLHFCARDGMPRRVRGIVRRCRQFAEGWYDLVIREDHTPESSKTSPPASAWSRFARLLVGSGAAGDGAGDAGR